jgi:hypothetical protein
VDAVADLVGNILEPPAQWTVVVNPPACGRTEFSGLNPGSTSALAINSKTELTDESISISISNPDQATQTWVGSSHVHAIELLYRLAGSDEWLPALTKDGATVVFFDDV